MDFDLFLCFIFLITTAIESVWIAKNTKPKFIIYKGQKKKLIIGMVCILFLAVSIVWYTNYVFKNTTIPSTIVEDNMRIIPKELRLVKQKAHYLTMYHKDTDKFTNIDLDSNKVFIFIVDTQNDEKVVQLKKQVGFLHDDIYEVYLTQQTLRGYRD